MTVSYHVEPDSILGKVLTHLAEKAETIVEIGTFEGLGSTQALARGLIRDSQRLWTLETDLERFKQSKSRYNDARITFLHGTAIRWIETLPVEIDLLFLDGADQTDKDELELLSKRSRIVVLDDTAQQKHIGSRCYFLNHGWRVLLDLQHERVGIAAFERQEFLA